jgi:hypothetical protein
MGHLKCDHIKRMITLTNDDTKRLSWLKKETWKPSRKIAKMRVLTFERKWDKMKRRKKWETRIQNDRLKCSMFT